MTDMLTQRNIQLPHRPDAPRWIQNNNGQFTVRALQTSHWPSITDYRLSALWKTSLPNKIKIFIWTILCDCHPAANNYIRCIPNLNRSPTCTLCNSFAPKDQRHIFLDLKWSSNLLSQLDDRLNTKCYQQAHSCSPLTLTSAQTIFIKG